MFKFIKLKSISIEYLFFVFARISGIVVKPLLLSILLKFSLLSEAGSLSQVYLFTSGLLILYSLPVYFDFYKYFFNDKKKIIAIRNEFRNYLVLTFLHLCFVTPVAFFIIYLNLNAFLFSAFVLVLLISEKLFDEIQRFFQFSKMFYRWSVCFLCKMLIPFIISLCLVFLEYSNIVFIYIFVQIIVNLMIFFFNVPKVFVLILVKSLIPFDKSLFKKYFNDLFFKFGTRFIQGISTSNILNADRWLVSILFSKLFLSELMIASQIANSINVGTMNLVFSHRRSEYLRANNSMNNLFAGRLTSRAIGSLTILSLVSFLFLSHGVLDLKMFTFEKFIMVVVGYVCYSFSASLTEYLYWNGDIRITVSIDFLFYFVMVFGGYTLNRYNNMENIVYFFAGGLVVRFMIQYMYTSIVLKRYSKDGD
jgi:hypothetical protein